MNFFLNHALISLITVPTPQNIFLIMIIDNKWVCVLTLSMKSSLKIVGGELFNVFVCLCSNKFNFPPICPIRNF